MANTTKTDPLAGLNADFRAKVQALIDASGGKVNVVSGFRNEQQQQALWNAALKKYGSEAEARKWVAPPGNSHHEQGTAVDFGGDLALAQRLAPQFGLSHPLSNEAWHFEPEGAGPTKGFNDAANTSSTQAFDPMAALAHMVSQGSTDTDMGTELPTLPEGLSAPTGGAAVSSAAGDAPSMAAEGGDWKASLSPAEKWIFTKESSLNPSAKNPDSTAFGIGQLLDYNRKKYLGSDWQTTDPTKQLTAARQYIKDRYGSAEAAQTFWKKNGYY